MECSRDITCTQEQKQNLRKTCKCLSWIVLSYYGKQFFFFGFSSSVIIEIHFDYDEKEAIRRTLSIEISLMVRKYVRMEIVASIKNIT